MDCLVHHQHPFWTGAVTHSLPNYHQKNYFSNFYFPRKGAYSSSYYPGTSLFFPHDDDVDYPTDMKGELSSSTMPYPGMADLGSEVKLCVVCGERASGFYFGALVCLPCKSFYIRCTKDGEPTFTCQCSGNCDIVKQGRIRCQYCRYQRCLMAGMCRKEKPETVQPAEGQVLCKVCGDIANGIHFGVNTCEGCKKFFRRGLVENSSYICKGEKDCGINPRNRNNCRYCRYQKCLSVGMSREAIKMGRPKKGDGSEVLSPPTASSTLRPIVDTDSCTQHTLTHPSGNDNNSNDALNISSVSKKIKEEEERSSCDFEKNDDAMTQAQDSQGRRQWQQCSHSRAVPATARSGNLASSEFIEEEMDEILMLLQNDNQAGNAWRSHKKLRSSNYNMTPALKDCKTECFDGHQGSPWHVTDLSSPPNMASMNLPMSKPLSPGQSASIAAHPPPQYPGFSGDFQPDQMSLPCDSPHHQMGSPAGYMSDCSAHSPGYPGSPVQSPACQYSPQHSPMYHSSPSPQHTEAAQHDYSSTYPAAFPMTDLSINVNCAQTPMAPSSPQHVSPAFQPSLQSSPSLPMTIPTQESVVNSNDNWPLACSPNQYCHSPCHSLGSPTSSQTIPPQERSGRNHATWYKNLNTINQFFSSQMGCDSTDLNLLTDDDMQGTVTRNDIEREVVYKMLSSLSPEESYYYVLSDNHNCSSDSSCSPSYDKFTSCRRMNKRKSFDNSEVCSMPGFQHGRYSRQLTDRYWQSSTAADTFPITMEKQALLEHLNKIFQQMSDRCHEASKAVSPQDGRNWQQIQLRIVRNTTAGVKFASQIPGFNTLHPEDKTFLCKTVTFMTSLLMAGHQQYSPVDKNFQDFWSWNIQPNNPFWAFKQQLIRIGEAIHALNMDQYEVSSLAALLYLASDFLDLRYPEAIEETRQRIIHALQSHLLSKGVDVKARMEDLFKVVPEIRHAGMWQQELMKQMKVNIHLHQVHQLFNMVQCRES